MLGIVSWLLSGLLAPLASLGEAWIRLQSDKNKIEAGVQRDGIQSATTIALALIGSWLTRIPIAILLLTVDLHVAAVFIDSTWPSDWLNPLALPEPYREIMWAVVVAQVGVGAYRVWSGRRL